MKRFFRIALTALFAVTAFACTNSDEGLQPVTLKMENVPFEVSLTGVIDGYDPQETTRTQAQTVVRIMWNGGESVYVYDGLEYLGCLTASVAETDGTYARLSGTLCHAPSGTKPITLVQSPGFTQAPAVTDGSISLDLSHQDGTDVPFLIYGQLPAGNVAEINNAVVKFSLATSVFKCNCTGLTEAGLISQAEISDVNTVCELFLSDTDAPQAVGSAPGSIVRTAGFSGSDQRAIFSVAVAKTDAAGSRVIEVTRNGTAYRSDFVRSAFGVAKSYNSVFALEKVVDTVTRGTAKRNGDIDQEWVQLWAGGPKFATCNVGASAPDDPGDTYQYIVSDPVSDNWGDNWRLPTKAELEALIDAANCTVTLDETDFGRLFTGKGDYQDNSIYLPATQNYGDGYYRSSTQAGDGYCYRLYFSVSRFVIETVSNDKYCSVRAVLVE
ncbi:MAG: DUF1566 domain-containing protein [Bacteroidaceae bacterium]|nr:DUF1566 domain-containing protein [Bacteroidaceae bacterium]